MEKDNITYEVCPHCEQEVELPNTLGVHVCPNCGKHIVNCSMCLVVNSKDNPCKDCVLCHQAENLNDCDRVLSMDLKKEMDYLASKLTSHFSDCYLDYTKNTKVVGIRLADSTSVELMVLIKDESEQTSKLDIFKIPIACLQHTLFLEELHKELDNNSTPMNFQELYDKAYQEYSKAYGEYPYRTIFCDEKDMITFNGFEGYVSEARLHLNQNITFIIGNSIMTINFNNIDLETYKKLKDIVDREEKEYEFNGQATVTINCVYGKGRTFREAKANAMMEVENALTLYGCTDTQIDDVHDNITLYI